MTNFAAARLNMVESQLRTNRVSDQRIIAAMETLPRETFLPEALRSCAYVDRSVKIGKTRHILDPMVFARMLQALEPLRGEMGLDLACGSGYSTAVMAQLCETVVGLESEHALVELGNTALSETAVDNALIVEGEIQEGYARQAPYDVILINGMVEELPQNLLDQLAPDGRLAAGIKDEMGVGRATLLQHVGTGFSRRILFDANAPLLPEFMKKIEFSF